MSAENTGGAIEGDIVKSKPTENEALKKLKEKMKEKASKKKGKSSKKDKAQVDLGMDALIANRATKEAKDSPTKDVSKKPTSETTTE